MDLQAKAKWIVTPLDGQPVPSNALQQHSRIPVPTRTRDRPVCPMGVVTVPKQVELACPTSWTYTNHPERYSLPHQLPGPLRVPRAAVGGAVGPPAGHVRLRLVAAYAALRGQQGQQGRRAFDPGDTVHRKVSSVPARPPPASCPDFVCRGKGGAYSTRVTRGRRAEALSLWHLPPFHLRCHVCRLQPSDLHLSQTPWPDRQSPSPKKNNAAASNRAQRVHSSPPTANSSVPFRGSRSARGCSGDMAGSVWVTRPLR